jgi:hypothetical protein
MKVTTSSSCGTAEPMRRNIKAGIGIGFLNFLRRNKVMIVAGAIMLVVGTIVSVYLGSVLVHDYTSSNISPLDARPYPVYGIISPLYAHQNIQWSVATFYSGTSLCFLLRNIFLLTSARAAEINP